MRLGITTVLLLVGGSTLPVFGGISPLPANLANSVDYINFTGPNTYPSSQLICVSAGCGGAFNPTISASSAGLPVGPAYTTTVWCVDYQLNVTTASKYLTNVTTLNNVSVPDSNVRYGNLDGLSSGSSAGWTYGLSWSGPGTVDTNSAVFRYTLAAALISQYAGNPGQLAGNPEDLAIQQAIWYITSNKDYTNEDPPFINSDGSSATVNDPLYWVNYVESNTNNSVSGLNLNSWAVVSGPANADGTLQDPSVSNGYNSYQTFLVEVTPEPSFYGLLAAGMVGLFFVARRGTKQRTSTESDC